MYNTDGYGAGIIRKVVNGVEVGVASFSSGYSQSQGVAYHPVVTIVSGMLSVEGFGNTLTLAGDATPLQISSFDLYLSQQDAYLDNINFTDVVILPPTADAGLNRTVTEGDAVQLDGTGSQDLDGNIVSYQWVQTGGPGVVLDETVPAQPSFTAPPVSGSSEVLVFELTVTDDAGLTGSDQVSITVLPAGGGGSFIDDFSADTTGDYTTLGGTGQMLYDAAGGRMRLLIGDNIWLKFSHALPVSDRGVFEFDFLPVTKYPKGGIFNLRLVQDADNYYEVYNTDGYGAGIIRKVVNGVEVGVASFSSGYSQGVAYHPVVTFVSGMLFMEGFGNTLTLAGDATPLQISSFDLYLSQQDGYLDNINFTDVVILPPTADAGLNRTVTEGDAVQLDGTGSQDLDGNIVSYQWVQTGGPGVVLDETVPAQPSFTAPPVSGSSEVLVFELTVTDDAGLTGSDQVSITVLPAGGGGSFIDDFSADTTGDYTTLGGTGQMLYDAAGGRMRLLIGDNIWLKFSHALPVSDRGVFEFDFLPVTKYPKGGIFNLRLVQDADNYYEVYNTDGYGAGIIRKVVNGVEVGVASFSSGYSQGVAYHPVITFVSGMLSVEGFGNTLTLAGDATPLQISSFDLYLSQQDAYLDNINFTDVVILPPTADAGLNRTVTEGDAVQLDGTGSQDLDGNIVSYQWVQTGGPGVVLDETVPAQPSFTAPPVSGSSEVLVFELTVTDDAGLTGSDQVSITVLPAGGGGSFIDDFSTDTTGSYDVLDIWTSGGTGVFFHDFNTMRARVLTGDNIGIRISRALLPASSAGTFQVDFQPTKKYPSGGTFVLRLLQDADNFFEIVNYDGYGPGYIRKVVNGVEVGSTSLGSGYSQKTNYHLVASFSSGTLTLEGFGSAVTLGGNATELVITGFDIELSQQDAYLDNLAYPYPLVFDYYLAIGDSITEGYNDDILQDGFGYEPILESLLTQSSGYLNIVMNEGVGGDTSAQGLSRLPAVLLRHPQAKYVLIQYGTNDHTIQDGLGLHPTDADYDGTFKDNMQQMIDMIVTAKKIPYLAKVPPLIYPYDSENTRLERFNQVVDELVSENGLGVVPPNLYCYFQAYPGLLTDSIHPDGTGYQAMAQLWMDSLLGVAQVCP